MTYQLIPTTETDRTSIVTTGTERFYDIAELADGGAIVTWSENAYSENASYSIVTQRYDANGAPLGDKSVVFWGGNAIYAYSAQPMVTGLEGGGYAISFKDVGSGGMYVATFNVLGQQVNNRVVTLPQMVTATGNFVNVTASGSSDRYSSITELANGGFAVTWSASYSGNDALYAEAQTVYSAVFTARGVLVGAPFQVAPWVTFGAYSYSSIANEVYGSAALDNGNYVILTRIGATTEGNDTGFPSIAIQIRASNGALVTGPVLVGETSENFNGQPAIVTLTDGSFVVAWGDSYYDDSGYHYQTFWQQFAANGVAIGAAQSMDGYNNQPTLSAMEGGGFILGSLSSGAYDPSFSGYATRFDANLDPVGDRQVIYARNDSGISYLTETPKFVTLGNGTIMGAWSGAAGGASYDVLVRQYMPERIGTSGNDVLTGADIGTAFYAGTGADKITGTPEADRIDGGAGNDTAFGNEGNDTLTGGDGDDRLYGGAGDDLIIFAAGNDVIDGGSGSDTLQFGVASTAVSIQGSLTGLTISTAAGKTSLTDIEFVQFTDKTLTLAAVLALRENVFIGTTASETLAGGNDDDLIMGIGGNDFFYGGPGDDTLISGGGNDLMFGGLGDDLLKVEGNAVTLIGADVINPLDAPLALPADWSRAAFDDIEAAETCPHISLQITGSNQTYEAFSFAAVAGQTWIFDVDGASFDSVLQLYDADGSRIASNDDSSTTAGAAGSTSDTDSLIRYEFTTDGTYTIGLRSYFLGDLTTKDTATLNISVQGPGIDALTSAHSVSMIGGAGNDTLVASGGDDDLIGGDGDDVLFGGAGADKIYGHDGNDTANYSTSSGAVTISLGVDHAASNGIFGWIAQEFFSTGTTGTGGDASGDIFYSIENLTGSAYNDRLSGNNQDNRLDGGAGNDTLTGGSGTDVFVFNGGKDVITDFHIGLRLFGMELSQAEQIEVDIDGINGFGGLMAHAVSLNGDTVFNFNAATSLTLEDVSLSNLTADMFAFL